MSFPDESFPDFPAHFWKLVELAKDDHARFKETVRAMKRDELKQFYWNFVDAASQFKGDPYRAFMSDQLSEDGVDDVSQWVVGQGREFYWNVVNFPKEVPVRVDHSPDILGVGEGEGEPWQCPHLTDELGHCLR